MVKRFDRAYFDRWYRGAQRITSDTEVRRKVTMAVTVAEYFLRRSLGNVLDVGCGETPWRTHLKALRPGASYRGIDPSPYIAQKFRVQQASFGDLQSLRIKERFDLVVCADVLHYLDEAEIRRGLRALLPLARGVVFFEVLAAEDDIVGDVEDMIRRPAKWYRDLFTAAGLTAAAPYIWLAPLLRDDAAAMEVSPTSSPTSDD
jgi:SAM-dependent methyltransferase